MRKTRSPFTDPNKSADSDKITEIQINKTEVFLGCGFILLLSAVREDPGGLSLRKKHGALETVRSLQIGRAHV